MSPKSRVCSAILFFLLPISLFSQTIEVRESSSLENLPFVHIYCTNHSQGVYSDVNGKADISSFSCDSLVFRAIGYKKLLLSKKEVAEKKVIYLHPDPLSIYEVVIAANHWEEERDEIPNQINSISKAEIRLSQSQTAADVLGQYGGVFVQKSQYGGGSPMIRGFAANRVLISVDGVRMNNAIFRSGNLQNLLNIDPFVVQRAEVLFGPGTVIYGSDAIGGVMDFHLLDADFSDKKYIKGEADLRYSSAANEKTGHLDLRYGSKNWSGVSSFSYNSFGDLEMGKYGPDDYLQALVPQKVNGIDSFITQKNSRLQQPSGFNQVHLFQKINYRHRNSKFSYSTYYSTSSDYTRYDRIMQERNGHPRYSEWYYGPQEWLKNELRFSNTDSNRLYDQLQLIVSNQRFEESRYSRSYQSTELSGQVEDVSLWVINLKAEKSLSSKTQLFYGAEFNFNKVSSTAFLENILDGTKTDDLSRYPDGSELNSQGVYTAIRIRLNTKHVLSSGLRFSAVQVIADANQRSLFLPVNNINLTTSSLNGSLGLKSKWTDFLQSYVNLSSAFRAPNLDDLSKVFDSEPGNVVVPNENLKPEYAVNGEAGLILNSSEKWQADLGIYYTHLFGAMVRRPYQLAGQDSIVYKGQLSQVSAVQNAAFSQIAGTWIGVNYLWDEHFRSGINFSYQQGIEEDESGQRGTARHVAPAFGQFFTQYAFKRGTIRFVYQFNSEISYEKLSIGERSKDYLYAKDALDRPYSPGWNIFSIYTQFALNRYNSIHLAWENISNQRYRPYSSGISAPGTNIIVAWRGHF